jgi:hypothetical protein
MNPLFASLSNIVGGTIIIVLANRAIEHSTTRVSGVVYGVLGCVGAIGFGIGIASLIGILFL